MPPNVCGNRHAAPHRVLSPPGDRTLRRSAPPPRERSAPIPMLHRRELIRLGFAAGGVLMGRLSDRFDIRLPVVLGALMLGLGYSLAAVS